MLANFPPKHWVLLTCDNLSSQTSGAFKASLPFGFSVARLHGTDFVFSQQAAMLEARTVVHTGPPNSTHVWQLIDRGVAKNFKSQFRSMCAVHVCMQLMHQSSLQSPRLSRTCFEVFLQARKSWALWADKKTTMAQRFAFAPLFLAKLVGICASLFCARCVVFLSVVDAARARYIDQLKDCIKSCNPLCLLMVVVARVFVQRTPGFPW